MSSRDKLLRRELNPDLVGENHISLPLDDVECGEKYKPLLPRRRRRCLRPSVSYPFQRRRSPPPRLELGTARSQRTVMSSFTKEAYTHKETRTPNLPLRKRMRCPILRHES